MWKVLVVICALGNPCTAFQQDPVEYFTTESECMRIATTKEIVLVRAFEQYGYQIQHTHKTCEKVPSA
jgi:hypothetical protein